MIRIVLENILLFLLPTVVYVAYVAMRRRDKPNNSPQQILDDAPLFWLLAAGAIVMLTVLAFFSTETGGRPGQGYEPPVYRDGKIVPGRKE